MHIKRIFEIVKLKRCIKYNCLYLIAFHLNQFLLYIQTRAVMRTNCNWIQTEFQLIRYKFTRQVFGTYIVINTCQLVGYIEAHQVYANIAYLQTASQCVAFGLISCVLRQVLSVSLSRICICFVSGGMQMLSLRFCYQCGYFLIARYQLLPQLRSLRHFALSNNNTNKSKPKIYK